MRHRNKILIAVAGLVIVVGTAATDLWWEPDRSYQEAVEGSAPAGWWRFDELRGDTAESAVPSGPDALYRGTVSRGGQGPLQNRLDTAPGLDGSSYVLVGDSFDFPGREPFSFEAWIRPRDPQPTAFSRILSKERFGPKGVRAGWSVYLSEPRGTIGFERRAGRRAQPAVAELDATDPVYRYVAGVFDGKEVHLYLDGELAARSVGIPALKLPDLEESLTIGRLWQPRTASYTGLVDEVAIYDRALTAAEIEAHWEAAR